METLARLAAPFHGLACIVGSLAATAYYADSMSLLGASTLMLWLISGAVLSHRYLKLEGAAEHRDLQWMQDRLLEASGEQTITDHLRGGAGRGSLQDP